MWLGLPSSDWMGALQVRGGKANRAPTHSALLRLTARLTPPTQSTPNIPPSLSRTAADRRVSTNH